MENNEYARYFTLDKYTKGDAAEYAYKEMAFTIRSISETYNNVKGALIFESYQDIANDLDTLSVLSITPNVRIERIIDLRLLIHSKFEDVISNLHDIYYGEKDKIILNDIFQNEIIVHHFL